ncbi:ribbon-helix-helix protein, CopG family [Nitrospira defluvii]|nr:ribbon-helix-helix protein, CopG family [Nitrospira defluvii]
MKTIQMTLDEELIKSVDNVVKKLHTSRSAFTRKALRQAISNYNMQKLEKKHRKGYQTHPVQSNEFDVWGNEQVWGE